MTYQHLFVVTVSFEKREDASEDAGDKSMNDSVNSQKDEQKDEQEFDIEEEKSLMSPKSPKLGLD